MYMTVVLSPTGKPPGKPHSDGREPHGFAGDHLSETGLGNIDTSCRHGLVGSVCDRINKLITHTHARTPAILHNAMRPPAVIVGRPILLLKKSSPEKKKKRTKKARRGQAGLEALTLPSRLPALWQGWFLHFHPHITGTFHLVGCSRGSRWWGGRECALPGETMTPHFGGRSSPLLIRAYF